MRKRLATVLLGACALVACSSNPTSSSGYVIAGDYTAASLTTTNAGTVTDQLAAGATVRVVLAADGSTTGRLFVPALGTQPATDADLAGTWSQSGDVVALHHNADTFLRDMPLTAHGQQLVGDRTFSGVRVQLTLARR